MKDCSVTGVLVYEVWLLKLCKAKLLHYCITFFHNVMY